jgi:Zn-dependent alcohol dehydrogenase
MHRAADGALLSAVLRSGAYADRIVVHEAQAVPVPAALPPEQACLLACGFSTGAGAALWATPVQPGSSVAVIVCGGVGLAVVQGARLAGAAQIVAVDVVPEKLELARELGATDVVEAAGSVDAVKALSDGGVDHAFSAIGAPAGLDDAVRMLAYGGTATLVGIPPPSRTLGIDLERDLFAPNVRIAVTHGGDTIPQQDFPVLAQAALDGRLDLQRFVTSTCALEEVPAALEALHAPTGVRTVALL